MEALGEPPRLLVFAREEQFARPIRLDLADVLNVHLLTKTFVDKYIVYTTFQFE